MTDDAPTPDPADPDQPDEPYNFQPPWLNRFLAELQHHEGHIERTCRAVGIRSKQLIYRYAKRDTAFAAALEYERESCRRAIRHELEDELLALARTGDIEHIRNVVVAGQPPERIKITRRMREILLILERLDPDRWAPKTPELEQGDRHVTFSFAMSDRDSGAIEDAEIIAQPALPPGQEPPDA